MPQLVPFFFVNQTLFTLVILISLFYLFSSIILPWFVRLFVSRLYIYKL
uniref:ATP synthase protein 8 n=1 Tax=Nannizziopsis barbatae TaxID=1007502 RepID=A0AA51QWU7_9EURO|nr:ATP synthase F0 subunit 8 [Nannizziopsis barbatae]WML69469.1 ATP synthase F0 subunit 8 [Nannizziopsis barbatae]